MSQYLHNDSLVCFLDDEPLPMKNQFHYQVAEDKEKLFIYFYVTKKRENMFIKNLYQMNICDKAIDILTSNLSGDNLTSM